MKGQEIGLREQEWRGRVFKEKVVGREGEKGALAIAGVLDRMSFRRRQESWKNVVVVVVVGVGFIQEMDVFACVKIAYQTPEDTE